jgi:mannosyltransferase OCH1-like enzyme
MIPKIIHYIHFGGEDKLSEFRKNVCLPSIYKYCSDWEIKVWDETNLDLNMNAYVRSAYEKKQYNFLSDYFRIYLLHKYGGVYIDTDVEIIKPLDDLLNNKAFCGIQQELVYYYKVVNSDELHDVYGRPTIALGLIIGAEPNDEYIKKLLDKFNASTASYSIIMTYTDQIFEKDGFVKENKLQQINHWTIYPSEYFCPIAYRSKHLRITDNTYTIHHYGK